MQPSPAQPFDDASSATAMQPLWQQVQQVFAPDGVLAQGNAGYRPRADQLLMAQTITRAICSNGVAVIEAGTGVGKTLPT